MQISPVFLHVSIIVLSSALQAQRQQMSPNSYFVFQFFTPQLFSNRLRMVEYNMHNLHSPNESGKVHFVSLHLGGAPRHLSDCDRYFAFIISTICSSAKRPLSPALMPHNAARNTTTKNVMMPVEAELLYHPEQTTHKQTYACQYTHTHTYASTSPRML